MSDCRLARVSESHHARIPFIRKPDVRTVTGVPVAVVPVTGDRCVCKLNGIPITPLVLTINSIVCGDEVGDLAGSPDR